MKLRFSKMHGLGNDFVVIDAISQKVTLTPERVRKLADRHFGIGCDQVLVVEAPQGADADFRYRIFNQDGGEVENCGNGARCFAVFVRQRKLTGKRVIRAETAGGTLVLQVLPDNRVTVDMGVPRLEPEEIPFISPARALTYTLPLAAQRLEISAVSMGNPHAVTLVDKVADYDVKGIGVQVENHTAFPKRVNAGFMEVVNRREIRVRVFERRHRCRSGGGPPAQVAGPGSEGKLTGRNLEHRLGWRRISGNDDGTGQHGFPRPDNHLKL